MADLQAPNWKPYEQTLWQEAEHKKETYWHHQKPQFATITDPLYGLRLSVLKNGQGHRGCPMKMFVRQHTLYTSLTLGMVLNYPSTGLRYAAIPPRSSRSNQGHLRGCFPRVQNTNGWSS